MLAARARDLLEPPSSVSLDVVGAALRARGEAPHPWIVEAKRVTKLLPGVTHLDTTELVDVDRRDLTERVRRIGQIVIRFVTDTAQPVPEDEAAIDALANEMRALLDIARAQGVDLRLTFVGHTDSSGSESRNAPLSEERATFLRGALARRGVDVAPFAARGVATSAPVRPEATADDAAFNRSVTLEVALED
jgi:OOP family OmpA-OmpF porin